MNERAFEHLSEESVFSGHIIDVVVAKYRFPDGEEATREIVRHQGAVGIVAHDGTNVFLTRQPREAIDDPDSLEIPAGRRDQEGEDPEDTARRELAEEIGQRPGSIEFLRSYYSSAGAMDEKMLLYLATDLSEHHEDSGENERIEIVAWPLTDLDGAIAATSDAKTIIGLMLLRDRLS